MHPYVFTDDHNRENFTEVAKQGIAAADNGIVAYLKRAWRSPGPERLAVVHTPVIRSVWASCAGGWVQKVGVVVCNFSIWRLVHFAEDRCKGVATGACPSGLGEQHFL